jgi:predicted Zn-dependent protease
MQYLVAAYDPDKLNDPGKAEPVLQHMIQADPADPSNYFRLARLYEDAGVYDEAERIFLAAKDNRPNEPSVYTSLASYYNRQGRFDKTIAALEQRAEKDAKNPEAWQTIAVYYQDEARKDSRLRDAEKKDYVLKGITAVDKALSIKPDYSDAMTYKGLLLRLEANLEKDPVKQQQLLKEANELRDKSEEIRKKRPAGA